MRKDISFICLAASVMAVLAFAQTPLQVTLSYSSSGITSIEFFIAKEKEFFQEEGLSRCSSRCPQTPRSRPASRAS